LSQEDKKRVHFAMAEIGRLRPDLQRINSDFPKFNLSKS